MSEAWHSCPAGGICPDGNMCCPATTEGNNTNYSTCLSGGKTNADGSCCYDDDDEKIQGTGTSTGCKVGYECSYEHNNNLLKGNDNYYCKKVNPNDDTLPNRLPRHRLCHVPERVLKEVYGFSVSNNNNNNNTSDQSNWNWKQRPPQLAYLSTMGPIDSNRPDFINLHTKVETLILMIHGSSRNVDDYICCINSALPQNQQDPQNSTIMILTPWFLAPEDEFTTFYNTKPSVEPLRWAEIGSICHTWRYGANAINYANYSSYSVVDSIINYVLQNPVRFSSLKRIVVAGHSAGGQYTQRWALLSNNHVFVGNNNNESQGGVSIRVVVANPKSYCYLDNRRMIDINGTFHVPPLDVIDQCPSYDEWEWGFGDGKDLLTPYKDNAIQEAGGINNVITRYSSRDVIYLSGEEDILPNGSCEERIQGIHRRERSERFFQYLIQFYNGQQPVHKRFVVPNVNHDHCLMFQSKEGQEALFGTFAFS